MERFKRIAIVDRSLLAHNVYQILLQPLGYSLFPFKNLKEFKEKVNWRWRLGLFLISSNAFGGSFKSYCEWFQKEKNCQPIPKVFLCEAEEKNVSAQLKKMSKSRILFKPFYPEELTQMVRGVFKENRHG